MISIYFGVSLLWDLICFISILLLFKQTKKLLIRFFVLINDERREEIEILLTK